MSKQLYKIDVKNSRVGVKIVYKSYKAIDQFFEFEFKLVDEHGNFVNPENYMCRLPEPTKIWNEVDFEFVNNKGPLRLVLFASGIASKFTESSTLMFFLNIGQISVFDIAAVSTLTDPDVLCVEATARHSFHGLNKKGLQILDIYMKTYNQDPNIRIKNLVLSKGSRFIYNIYFQEFVVKHFIFEPESDGCETLGLTAITEEGFFIENTRKIRICQNDILPIQFTH